MEPARRGPRPRPGSYLARPVSRLHDDTVSGARSSGAAAWPPRNTCPRRRIIWRSSPDRASIGSSSMSATCARRPFRAHFLEGDVRKRLLAPLWRKTSPAAAFFDEPFEVQLDWHIDHYLPIAARFIEQWIDASAAPDCGVAVKFLTFEAFKDDPRWLPGRGSWLLRHRSRGLPARCRSPKSCICARAPSTNGAVSFPRPRRRAPGVNSAAHGRSLRPGGPRPTIGSCDRRPARLALATAAVI